MTDSNLKGKPDNTIDEMGEIDPKELEKITLPSPVKGKLEFQFTPTIDSEVDEMLFMAFVGLWVRDEEGNFVSLDDKYGVLKDHLKQDITNLIAQENERYLKTHAHNTKDGWCCACDYDIAVMRSESAQEANKAVIAELEKLHRYDGKDYDTELDEIIDDRIAQLTADKKQNG